jgi:hypothetical protein
MNPKGTGYLVKEVLENKLLRPITGIKIGSLMTVTMERGIVILGGKEKNVQCFRTAFLVKVDKENLL